MNGTSTTVTCPWALVAALDAASTLNNPQGPPIEWRAESFPQEAFLEKFRCHRHQVGQIVGMEAQAAFDVNIINQWLGQKGYSIRLQPLQPSIGARPFAAAGIVDLMANWPLPADVSQVVYEGTRYPAFQLKQGAMVVYESPNHPHPILRPWTVDSNQSLYITILDQHPGDGDGLLKAVEWLADKREARSFGYRGAVIPMVRLSRCQEHEWLRGLWATAANGDKCSLMEVEQETRLRLNQYGARVESAAAMSGLRSMSVDEPYRVNRPFLFWWEQADLGMPIVAAFVMPDCWQDPGDLRRPF